MKNGIIINNVSFAYEKNINVLQNISFTIKPKTFLGIAGLNGSGKTTFIYLLNGLIPHHIKGCLSGEISVDNFDTHSQTIAFFAKRVGMVFQNPDFSLFNLTVKEEIEFGLKNLNIENSEEKMMKALKTVGLADYIDRDPQTLSFGEKQKVALACILALDTNYIVLDEPSAMLDYKSSIDLYKTLQKLNKGDKTIIVVEHDTDLLWQFSKETLIMDQGKLIASGPTKNILSQAKLIQEIGLKVPSMKNEK